MEAGSGRSEDGAHEHQTPPDTQAEASTSPDRDVRLQAGWEFIFGNCTRTKEGCLNVKTEL